MYLHYPFRFVSQNRISSMERLGIRPEKGDKEKTFELAQPPGAKEILIFASAETTGEGDFHRDFFEFSTSQEDKKFAQYQSVATDK